MNHSETEVAAVVADWLEASGCDVYEEVVCGSKRADLVGVRGKYRVIVEVKTSFSWSLIAQGLEWIRRGRAHHVYIAAPTSTGDTERRMLAPFGLGTLCVHMRYGRVEQQAIPRFARVREPIQVVPEQRRGSPEGIAAGTASGGHWTTWRGSMRVVTGYVKEHPGCTAKAAIKEVGSLHYSSNAVAVQCVRLAVLRGEIPALRAELIDGVLRLYPTEPSA